MYKFSRQEDRRRIWWVIHRFSNSSLAQRSRSGKRCTATSTALWHNWEAYPNATPISAVFDVSRFQNVDNFAVEAKTRLSIMLSIYLNVFIKKEGNGTRNSRSNNISAFVYLTPLIYRLRLWNEIVRAITIGFSLQWSLNVSNKSSNLTFKVFVGATKYLKTWPVSLLIVVKNIESTLFP